MADNNYFLHIGWSKTATTSIQDVLSRTDGINYLGRPFSEEMFQLMAYFTYSNDIFFSDIQFQDRLNQVVKGNESQIVIISDEHLRRPLNFLHSPVHPLIFCVFSFHERHVWSF